MHNEENIDLSEPQYEAVIFDIDGTLSDCEHRRYLVDGVARCACGAKGMRMKHEGGFGPWFALCSCKTPLVEHPVDWDAFFDGCDQDPMNVPVVLMARMLHMKGYRIILVTGRPERVRGKTVDWLGTRGIWFDHLMMRPDGDHRPDDELKRLALTNNIETGLRIPRERILGVFDDRESVVKMWRDEGLTVFQVAEGKF